MQCCCQNIDPVWSRSTALQPDDGETLTLESTLLKKFVALDRTSCFRNWNNCIGALYLVFKVHV
jgi:hypothetical protein